MARLKVYRECHKCGRMKHIAADCCDCEMPEYWRSWANYYRKEVLKAEALAAISEAELLSEAKADG